MEAPISDDEAGRRDDIPREGSGVGGCAALFVGVKVVIVVNSILVVPVRVNRFVDWGDEDIVQGPRRLALVEKDLAEGALHGVGVVSVGEVVEDIDVVAKEGVDSGAAVIEGDVVSNEGATQVGF